MNFKSIDFSIIKIAVLFFIISLIAAVLCANAIDMMVDESEDELFSITQSLNLNRDKLNKRLDAISLDNKIHHKYSDLYGFSYAKPDKLRWLEQVKLQAEFLNIPSMAYNIKARQLSEQFSSTLTGDFVVYMTEIDLQLGLLHEPQLLQLFDRLKQAELGVFSVENCLMALNGDITNEFKPAKANITGQCLIQWYEIDKRQLHALAFDPGAMP